MSSLVMGIGAWVGTSTVVGLIVGKVLYRLDRRSVTPTRP